MGWKKIFVVNDEELINIRDLSPFQLEAKIAIFMDEAQHYESCLEVGIIIDCYFNLYMFANAHKLTNVELVSLLKLLSELLVNCEKGLDIQDNLKVLLAFFKKDNNNFHNINISKNVVDYFMQSFFQHYELYSHLFHHTQIEEVVSKEISLDVIPVSQPYPPPLEEAVSSEWYNLYINPQPEVEEEKEAESEEIIVVENSTPIEENQADEDDAKINKVESLLVSLSKDDMKNLIKEITVKRLSTIKTELESKIKDKEATLMKNLEKSLDKLKIL